MMGLNWNLRVLAPRNLNLILALVHSCGRNTNSENELIVLCSVFYGKAVMHRRRDTIQL
jgi:hypothetical protein